jgi:HEAT repeats
MRHLLRARHGDTAAHCVSRPEVDRRCAQWLVGACMILAVVASGAPGLAATEDQNPPSAPSAPRVVVQDGRLTMDVRDADLAEVLERLAARAGFRLTTTGSLGRVTASFADVSVETGIRRLAGRHDLMLVYAPADPAAATSDLIAVHVFAAPPPPDPGQAARDLTEINALLRTPGDPRSIARLQELLASASSAVRARAAWAIGRIGTASNDASLTRALSDESPAVRRQALYAVRRLEEVRAIPALQAALLRDPDVGVRRAAARLLGTLAAPAAAAALAAGSGDPDPSVRQEIARALQRQTAKRP